MIDRIVRSVAFAWLGLSAGLWLTSPALALNVDARWKILAGTAPLEMTAGKDLARELNAKFRLSLDTIPATASAVGPAIVIGTVADNALIAQEHARQPFNLSGTDQERYHLMLRGDKLFCVGATPKGAMNAAFRFADRASLQLDGIDEARSPVFRQRVAGHLMNQRPPPGWTEDDQARFYARHFINVVWGEKHGPPLSYEARQKYGLGLMVEFRFPSSASPVWWKDPANATAAYYLKPGGDRRVISPFDPLGRQWYLDGHKRLLEQNPDVAILYAIFGDYNVIPGPDSVRISDGQAYGHTYSETILEVLKIMKEAIGTRNIVPRAWMWHSFDHDRAAQESFMRELPNHGFGPMYNEAGDDDCWVIKLDNFDESALQAVAPGTSAYGPDYISLVSAGGACESVNPVIGMPLPRVAAYKLGRLAAAGVRDVALWWASGEGWVYQPNLEVLKEVVWSDDPAAFGQSKNFAAVKPLLQRIAERDFGPKLAPQVVQYWQRYDEALVTDRARYQTADEAALGDPTREGLRIYDWFQRMGVYSKWPFGSAILLPLTPQVLANSKYGGWGQNDYAIANYKAVLDHLTAARNDLRELIATASDPAARERLQSMNRWTELYRLLTAAQYHHLQALHVMKDHAGKPLDSPPLRTALAPVVKQAMANTEAIMAWATNFPSNFNINGAHRDVAFDHCEWKKESLKFQAKLDQMTIWLKDLKNLAPGKAVEASSCQTDPPNREPKYAVDGDPVTLWASQASDDEWIQIDLGQARPLTSLVLDWKTAYAKVFEVRVAPGDRPEGWVTVLRCDDGKDGTMQLALPTNTIGRYVRVQGIQRGTPYGYALREIQIFGE